MNVSALKIWNDQNGTKMYLFETNKCSYLAVTNYDRLNQQKNEAYNLQCTNITIMTTIKITIDHMSMHCSINMQNPKLFYWFKLNNLTYLGYDDTSFKNKECELIVNIVLIM